jgi:hypothetical protein
MVYRSKVDWWLAVILIAVPFVPVCLAVYLREPALYVIPLVVIALYGAVALPLSYETGSERLILRHGLRRTGIPYSEIHAVRSTRSAVSSPALSLDRVEIEYGQAERVLISPMKKQDFLSEMRTRVPHVDG